MAQSSLLYKTHRKLPTPMPKVSNPQKQTVLFVHDLNTPSSHPERAISIALEAAICREAMPRSIRRRVALAQRRDRHAIATIFVRVQGDCDTRQQMEVHQVHQVLGKQGLRTRASRDHLCNDHTLRVDGDRGASAVLKGPGTGHRYSTDLVVRTVPSGEDIEDGQNFLYRWLCWCSTSLRSRDGGP